MTEDPKERVPDPYDTALGAVIRVRRKELGISQEKLAEDVGITFQQIQKYENAANRVSWSRVNKIAKALSMTVGDIETRVNILLKLDVRTDTAEDPSNALSHNDMSLALEIHRLGPGKQRVVRNLVRELATI